MIPIDCFQKTPDEPAKMNGTWLTMVQYAVSMLRQAGLPGDADNLAARLSRVGESQAENHNAEAIRKICILAAIKLRDIAALNEH
ncbi:hypothetical protein A3A67_01995 [Candidatus Peribacteria bacterium RIFCSPLOWO2_01_FULL_51_18]|nr:MAG: hypothetical protein A3C52_05360 [Candidatus Peribacteria bacterium RIFCSPHIGHO2_02_FULL_51_15]OGJ65594.1 MAG: hypothetical protein A3A67_01995 [Candidatus Peribacteria bacterium RIFCSPLOWO2_01_FULL_51_18]OGJ68495.1 MAG: hypothetical protein A3J34_03570 [Candidatus Peribacteria bacterium RIFCSPLOWO2_02_FULL_51_10]